MNLQPARRSQSDSPAGDIIGPYHLLEFIGEGGMGLAWLAEPRERVKRRVALKLIKAAIDTPRNSILPVFSMI
jgi:eukaryotic-like serine/threonine-protein kinase